MTQFRAVIQGQRGAASKLGSKSSGIEAHVNGWGSGITVIGYYNKEKDRDEFTVILNEGNGYNSQRTRTIGTFTSENLEGALFIQGHEVKP
jgi:hypothetical protein